MGDVTEEAGVEHSGWSECDCDRIFEQSVAENGEGVDKDQSTGTNKLRED